MRYFISILGLALVVGVGYFAVAQYINVAHGQSSLLVPDQAAGDVSASGAQVLSLLNTLKGISLNGQIFTDPEFQSLQDWTVDISPQTVGRANPYLPTVGSAPAAAASTKVSLPRSTR